MTKDEIARPVVAWYNETAFYNYSKNNCLPDKVCGHYTQVKCKTQNEIRTNVKNPNYIIIAGCVGQNA